MNRVRYGYAAAASIMNYYEYNVRISLALLYPPQALVCFGVIVRVRINRCVCVTPVVFVRFAPSDADVCVVTLA